MNWGEEDKSLEWVVYDTLEEENKKLEGRIKELEDWKRKWAETFGMIMAEKCPEDEIHCGCVPFLRVKVKELEAENEKLRGVAGDAYDWAILHRIEMRSGVWHRLKQALERA